MTYTFSPTRELDIAAIKEQCSQSTEVLAEFLGDIPLAKMQNWACGMFSSVLEDSGGNFVLLGNMDGELITTFLVEDRGDVARIVFSLNSLVNGARAYTLDRAWWDALIAALKAKGFSSMVFPTHVGSSSYNFLKNPKRSPIGVVPTTFEGPTNPNNPNEIMAVKLTYEF